MSIKVGINGFGRIGRLVFRAGITKKASTKKEEVVKEVAKQQKPNIIEQVISKIGRASCRERV